MKQGDRIQFKFLQELYEGTYLGKDKTLTAKEGGKILYHWCESDGIKYPVKDSELMKQL